MIKIEDILAEWQKDAKIDQSKLDAESIGGALLHAKYLQILSGIRVGIRKRKSRLEILSADKKLWLQGKMDQGSMDRRGWDYDPMNGNSKPLKGEQDAWVKLDPEVRVLRDEIADLEICLCAALEIVNNVNWRHQSIKNAIDWKKFEAGV